jgi:hypothetical protein
MELAIAAVVGIVAVVLLARNAPSAPVDAGGGNQTGPAVQLLQEQPGSTAGQSGSGSMDPVGKLPPFPNNPVRIMPRRIVALPINTAPAPRLRLPLQAPVQRPRITFTT